MGLRDNRKKSAGKKSAADKTKILNLLKKYPLMQCVGIAILLNLLVEMFSRRSALEGLQYLISSPLLFTYNTLIVLLTVAVGLLFRKRMFAISLISAVWLGLGITNCVLLGFRTTPLAAIDFQLFKSVKDIIEVYLSPMQIVLIFVAGIISLAGIYMIWRRSSRYNVNYKWNGIMVASLAVVLFFATNISVKAETLASSFGNLAGAYEEYGFAYCFSESVIDRGIGMPPGYSENRMKQIVSLVSQGANDGRGQEQDSAAETQPNIIMVQLESFFDVNYIKGITFSENPVPVFQSLKEKYSTGFLTVPSIGAGTANTEFEVISGMSLDFFGTGEYPYKTILKQTAAESICTDLKKLGYVSHAIHNHKGTFYDRHLVYPNLGFDYFTSLEYMSNVEKTKKKWAKDNVLDDEVMKALNATEGKDFIYTITVQSHGKYPEEVIDPDQRIKVHGFEEEGKTNAFEYYVNQLKQVDDFIQNLTSNLSDYDEPVVLILFGDHLPSLDLTNKDLENGDTFQTEYIMWSNFPMEKVDRNLYGYQLTSYVTDRLGIPGRVLAERHKVNLNRQADFIYLEDLELLEYDMLYGERYIYGGMDIIQPSNMIMDSETITIQDARNLYHCVYLDGSNFTKWSFVEINGKRQKTVFLDDRTILVAEASVEPGDEITVVQAGDNEDYEILGQTAPFIFRPDLIPVEAENITIFPGTEQSQ